MYEKYQALLDKTNKTSYQVSKETGISQTAFSNWKTGRNSPGVESLKKLADYFGVSIEYFIGDGSEKDENYRRFNGKRQ